MSSCFVPEEVDLRIFIYAHTHSFLLVCFWVTEPWTLLVLHTQQFFYYQFKFAHKNLDLGPLCLCEKENKVLARAVLCKDFLLTGNKFSNSDYKVASGNAEKLLNCRSSLRISCPIRLFFCSGQQRKFFLSLYLCCNVPY